jgi:hypothetical protein
VKKNAIMQIDFALEAERGGMTPDEAIYQGRLIPFRPIMMTTMAAMLGAVPIAIGYGAGGEARQPLGRARRPLSGALVHQLEFDGIARGRVAERRTHAQHELVGLLQQCVGENERASTADRELDHDVIALPMAGARDRRRAERVRIAACGRLKEHHVSQRIGDREAWIVMRDRELGRSPLQLVDER